MRRRLGVVEHQIIADLGRRRFAGFHAAARLLGEHVAGFAQWPGDHRFAQRLPQVSRPSAGNSEIW